MDLDVIKKINNRTANVMVVGLGYVGLPLSIQIANAGYNLLGYDNSVERVNTLKLEKSPFVSLDSGKISAFAKNPRVLITNDKRQIQNADIIIICLPTPLDEYYQPDLSIIEGFLQTAKDLVKKESLISLESTTWPGTTEEVILPVFESVGLSVGENFFLGYSPEREDPGNPIEMKDIPKVIGGHTSACRKAMNAFYSSIFNKIHEVSCCRTAEFTKLVENIQRMVNISLVNDLKVLANKMDINIFEVIDAAATKPFGFTPYYPGPGLGGHCIPVDPFYLTWKAKQYGIHTRFIELSGEINMSVRNYVIDGISCELNKAGKPLKNSKILIIGVAYKRNVNDVRESPSLYIIEQLLEKGGDVSYHDKFVPYIEINKKAPTKLHSKVLNENAIKAADIVVVLTDHTCTDYELIAGHAKNIIDTRGVKTLRGIPLCNIY